ncbi:MAG TPA: MoxR family ATPase, partial [Gemmatimonadaceae bacterium]|nr:MoxR family ATPase [Gemmatimonadaceae bacterium]
MTTQSTTSANHAVHPSAVGSGSRDGLLQAASRLRTEIGKRIVGQEQVVEEVLMAMLAGGHALLVGVPGLAKTLMISSIAEAMRLDFRRIQFTPDLVPSDITGT